jgi:hypothetical protein
VSARDFGAFVRHGHGRREATGRGVLDGRTFAVKDLIDVAGTRTGGGNPGWLAQQAPAVVSAPVVEQALAAGATLIGKTVTDELAFSLEGRNVHYPDLINPICPDRLPGGSSSGSAVAVAAGQTDFALGTDTGGSVRVPAILTSRTARIFSASLSLPIQRSLRRCLSVRSSANWSVATSGSLFWASIGLIDSLLKTFSGWRRSCRTLEPVPSLTL